MNPSQETFPPIVDLTNQDLGLIEPFLIAEVTNDGNAIVANIADSRASFRDSIYGFLRHISEEGGQQ